MRLSYAKAATFALGSAALLQASVCSRMPAVQEPDPPRMEQPPPRFEFEPSPAGPPRILPLPQEQPPRQEPEESPDGGAPTRDRERPSPYNPLHEEAQSRLAMR